MEKLFALFRCENCKNTVTKRRWSGPVPECVTCREEMFWRKDVQ